MLKEKNCFLGIHLGFFIFWVCCWEKDSNRGCHIRLEDARQNLLCEGDDLRNSVRVLCFVGEVYLVTVVLFNT